MAMAFVVVMQNGLMAPRTAPPKDHRAWLLLVV